MDDHSQPSIVNCDTTSSKNKSIYDAWAAKYENDIREWGYVLPEVVAKTLREQMQPLLDCNPQNGHRLRILDAGAGDGLSGVALRTAGFDRASTHLAGNDISPGMLEIAEGRRCYDDTELVDLNECPLLPYATDEFDAVTCTGTMTYINPKSGILEEFVRITRPGGYICYTNRTDKLDDWRGAESELERNGSWRKVAEPIGPIPYLPLNKEYGKDVEVVIFLYQVLESST